MTSCSVDWCSSNSWTELTGRWLIVGLELYAGPSQNMELKTTSFLSSTEAIYKKSILLGDP